MYSFKKIILLAIANLILFSCGNVKQIPIETKTLYNYVDSLVIRDSTIFHSEIVIKDYTNSLDTLYLAGEHSSATAYLDTAAYLLKGELKEKPWQEKIVFKDRIIQRDSLIYKEVPVEVIKEVPVQKYPKWHRFLLIYYVITMLYFTYKIGRRFKFF